MSTAFSRQFLYKIASAVGAPLVASVVALATLLPAMNLGLSLTIGYVAQALQEPHGSTLEDTLIFPILAVASLVIYCASKLLGSCILQKSRRCSRFVLFEHLLSVPARDLIERTPGSIESLCQEASFATRALFGTGLQFAGRLTGTLGGTLVLTVLVFPEMTAFYLAWIVIYVPYAVWASRRSTGLVGSALMASSAVSGVSTEVIQNLDLVQSFGSKTHEADRFGRFLESEFEAYSRAQRKIDLYDLFGRALQILPAIATYLIICQPENRVDLPLGTLVGQLSLALMFGTLTGDLGRGVLDLQEMSKRLGTALAALGWRPAVAPGLSIGDAPVDWDIIVSDLEFRYPNSLNGIKSSNIRIKKGEKIGLQGPSGAGKSTFLGLISGRYHPQSGEVRIGGVPAHQIPSELLVRGLTQVSQSAPVFHRSILENLTYGCPEVSRDRVWQTLEKVKLAEYVKRLPEGLDTLVGNSGQKLSGGERARLALARALYWDSQIILLDEATAALDLDTEEAIMTGLRSWLRDRTVICVSHRPSLLKEMNRILVVQDGRVEESAQGS